MNYTDMTERERARRLRRPAVGLVGAPAAGTGVPARPAPAGLVAPPAAPLPAVGGFNAEAQSRGAAAPRLFVDSDGIARSGFNMGKDGRRLGLVPTDAAGVPLGTQMVSVQGLSQGTAEVGRDMRYGPPPPVVLAPQLPVQPGDQPGGINAYARAVNVVGGYQAPPMNAREAARMADLDATRGLRWNPSGPTSAVTRAVGLVRDRAAEEAEAARRRGFQGGLVRQQGESAERQEAIKAAGGVAERVFEAQGRRDEARETGAAARDVAGTRAGADKYAADKALEGKKAEVEAETIRYNRDRDDRMDREDAERRALIAKAEQERIDKNTMSYDDLDKIIGDNGGMVPLVRDVLNNPDINDGEKRRRLHNLSQKLYGRDANYIMGIYEDVAPYVDIRNRRAGVQGSGKPLPGAKWEKR